MFFLKEKLIKIGLLVLLLSLMINLNFKGLAFAIENQNNENQNQINQENIFSLAEFLKNFLEQTKIYLLLPKFSLSLLAAVSQAPAETQTFITKPMKDLSTFNLAVDRYYKRPWETNGLLECEPWGKGKGISICLAPVFPGDPPCPIFMDCDGDGHYWFKGEDCDENCPTCYVGSKFYTEFPDGRDQDCDGLIDDNIECIPQFGSSKTFGYDSNCNFTSNTNYTLINEGEVGEIPIDEIHCQKRWGECTDYQGGFGNCTVNKTPGYFVKSNGVVCGGGIWRQSGGNAIFNCSQSLREKSYGGYYGCGLDCCKPPWVCDQWGCSCGSGCGCNNSPCPICYPCQKPPPQQPIDACNPGNCSLNAIFENSSQKGEGSWALCHGYNEVSCKIMTGCQRKYVENKYY